MEIEAADDAELLVEVAFGVEVAAEAGADKGQRPQPVHLLGKQLAFFTGNVDLDLSLILVFEKFLDAVVQLQNRGDEDEPVMRKSNDFFEIIIGRAGVQELRH